MSHRTLAKGTLAAYNDWRADLTGALNRPTAAPYWLCEIVRSIEWVKVFAYDFAHAAHINVKETRMLKSFIKYAAKNYPDSRLPVCIDSSVCLGAQAKGRSSSQTICRVLQGSLPYVLGSGLYVGGLQTPTEIHRADDPSAWCRHLLSSTTIAPVRGKSATPAEELVLTRPSW